MTDTSCGCSILDAREEKLLLEKSRLEVRLVCNRCNAILERQHLPLRRMNRPWNEGDLSAAESAG